MSRLWKSTLLTNARGLVNSLAGRLRGLRWLDGVVVLVGLMLAIAIRYSLLDFKSVDYFSSLKPWYNTIRSEGFSAFATDFSNYNPPYLYLLYLVIRFLPDLPPVVAVKLPAIAADFACGGLVYLIVRMKYPDRWMPSCLAGLSVLFAPTVVLNSAFWGQADALYTAALLACIYLLLIRRSTLAMLAYGVALAFKLQAVFFLPVLLALVLKNTIPWKAILLIPAALLTALVPAWIAGRPVVQLLQIYVNQAAQYESLTMNAASIYAWLPDTRQVFNLLYIPGVILAASAAFVWFVVVYRSTQSLEGPILLEIAVAAFLIVPFFLPKMHERYFYPADILAITLAFFFPRLYYIPILLVGVSFISYQPFLFEAELVPLPILSFVLLVAISILSYDCILKLYSHGEADADS